MFLGGARDCRYRVERLGIAHRHCRWVAGGFRPHGSASGDLGGSGLVDLAFGFAFEWLFLVVGLFAGTPQAAQGMAFLVFPLTFVSSAYVPVSSMPGWLQAFAEHQPVTYMVDAVWALTLGGGSAARVGAQCWVFHLLVSGLGGRDSGCFCAGRGGQVRAGIKLSTGGGPEPPPVIGDLAKGVQASAKSLVFRRH